MGGQIAAHLAYFSRRILGRLEHLQDIRVGAVKLPYVL
jgi:hypothetical protein